MATLTLDPGSLSHLLTALGPPAFDAATCAIEGDAVAVRLAGVRSGVRLLGRQLGPLDAEIRIRAERVDARRIRLAWELGEVAGVPSALLRMAAGAGLVQPLIRKLLDRLGLEGAVELEGDAAIVHLDRLPARNGVMRLARCQRFDVPAGKGQALACTFTLAAPDAEADADHAADDDHSDGDSERDAAPRRGTRKRH